MRRSTRVLLALLVIEALLAAGAGWLIWQLQTGALQAVKSADASATVVLTQVGGIMGALAGVMLVVAVVLRLQGK